MAAYITVDDVTALWKPLTAEQQKQVSELADIVSDLLRQEAHNVGKDLDSMVSSGEILQNTVKSVAVDIIARYLEQVDSGRASTLTQESQSGLGYSWSGTYSNTGGGLSVLNKDLKKLGLRRQRYGFVDMLGVLSDD